MHYFKILYFIWCYADVKFAHVTWTKARNVQNQHMFVLISNPAGGNMTSTNAAKDWMSVVPLPFVVCQAKTVPIIEI